MAVKTCFRMKSFKHYLLIIAISLIPFISMFLTNLAPHTHDSPVHFARMAAYYKALSEGQILPRWAGELNYGYGMPLFNFIYHVPYLISSASIAMGGGLVFSFKISMLISFWLSGIFMYLFSLKFFKHEGRAFITTMLYQFAPFHLVDLVVRGDVAEGYALAFLPLVLFSVLSGHKGFIAVSTLLLITSHNSMSLVFFGIAVLFTLIFSKKKIQSFVGLGLGLGLASFYWLPALIERKYTYGDLFMKNMYVSHFTPLVNFFLPNFTNSQALQTGGIAVSFGLVQTIALVLAILARKKQHIILFSLFLAGFALFFMQPISKFFWSAIPILRMFQFPWRFLNITTFALSLLGGIVLVRNNTSRFFLAGIALLIIATTTVYFRPPLGFDPIDERYFWNYPLNTTYFGETDVIWSAGPAKEYPLNRFEVIGGDGIIIDAFKKGTEHSFTVHARTDVQIVDRTQYFPGWRVFNKSEKIPIEFQDQNWRGLITFRLSPGTHAIRVIWGDTPIRRIANIITVVSALFVFCFLLFPAFVKKKL